MTVLLALALAAPRYYRPPLLTTVSCPSLSCGPCCRGEWGTVNFLCYQTISLNQTTFLPCSPSALQRQHYCDQTIEKCTGTTGGG